MAVSALVRLSEDKVTRQAYQRRQDDIMLAAKKANDYKLMERRVEQEQLRAEKAEAVVAERDAENEQLKRQLAELRSQLGEK